MKHPRFRAEKEVDLESLQHLVGETIENEFHRVIGTIVSVETQVNTWNRAFPAFVLDDGTVIDITSYDLEI